MRKTGRKADAQKKHAKRRFDERYGIKLTQYVWDTILNTIRKGEHIIVERQSLRITVYDLTYVVRPIDISDDKKCTIGPNAVRVVYDHLRKTLVTALPLGKLVEDDAV